MNSNLERLLRGNDNFRKGMRTNYDILKTRARVAEGQKPFAIIVSCSDSRVVPEFIFDTNIGDLFVIRSAGNVLDKVGLGSVEYAVEHLQVPLIVVLGHENCGAIGATCSHGHAEGNIAAIVERIRPAAEKTKYNALATVDENVRHVMDAMVKESKIIATLKAQEKIEIVGMRYSLNDGSAIVIAKN